MNYFIISSNWPRTLVKLLWKSQNRAHQNIYGMLLSCRKKPNNKKGVRFLNWNSNGNLFVVLRRLTCPELYCDWPISCTSAALIKSHSTWTLQDTMVTVWFGEAVTNFAHAQQSARVLWNQCQSKPYGYCYDYSDCYKKKVIWKIETVPQWEHIIEVTISYSTYFSKSRANFGKKDRWC